MRKIFYSLSIAYAVLAENLNLNKFTNDQPEPVPAVPAPLDRTLDITQRSLKIVKSMLAEKLTGYTNGQDPAQIAELLTKNYGCYCFLSARQTLEGQGLLAGPLFNYHGPAVDPVDHLCRDMFLKQKCLVMDAENGYYGDNTICEPTRSYPWTFTRKKHRKTGKIITEIECGKIQANGSAKTFGTGKRACKMDNCNLEKQFVDGVFDLYVNQGYQHNKLYEGMDEETYLEHCRRPGGSGGRNLEKLEACCGNKGMRVPFNSLLKECCEDGKVRSIGGC